MGARALTGAWPSPAAADRRDRLAAVVAAGGADHVALAEAARGLAEAETRLAEAEQRWLELAEELGV